MANNSYMEALAIWAKQGAKLYTDSVALSGVPINYPTINPATLT